ncbi:MAG TPA: hypothetical protein VK856_00620 [Anaerolineaceae bacterium]|nr:hypothetical protein [Anaerolineaceae bacterium]
MNEIYQKVYKKYPQVAGKKPVCHNQPDGQSLLIFKGEGSGPNGVKIPVTIRVQVDQNGKIIKMSSSK